MVGGASSITNLINLASSRTFSLQGTENALKQTTKERALIDPQPTSNFKYSLLVMSTSDSPNKRAILALKGEQGNDVCADCGRKGENLS
jgi:hypothetical protein